LLGIDRGTNYLLLCAQLVAIGGGLGLLVPPLTSALLGTVEKAKSGVLNATRQTGSVLGVALFGALVGNTSTFVAGARGSLIISAVLLICASVVILLGGIARGNHDRRRNIQTAGTARINASRIDQLTEAARR
jgi:MFS transporter, DHA2 family, methylenomycin A resistance protein